MQSGLPFDQSSLSLKPPGSGASGPTSDLVDPIVFGYCLCIHNGTRQCLVVHQPCRVWPSSYP